MDQLAINSLIDLMSSGADSLDISDPNKSIMQTQASNLSSIVDDATFDAYDFSTMNSQIQNAINGIQQKRKLMNGGTVYIGDIWTNTDLGVVGQQAVVTDNILSAIYTSSAVATQLDIIFINDWGGTSYTITPSLSGNQFATVNAPVISNKTSNGFRISLTEASAVAQDITIKIEIQE